MEILRDSCVELSKLAFVPQSSFDPQSTAVVDRLRGVLNSLDNAPSPMDPNLTEYVFGPIFSLLQKEELGDRQSEYVLLILSQLLDKGWANKLTIERSDQLIAVVSYIISPDRPGEKLTKFLRRSNELHSAGYKCFQSIFRASDKSGLIPTIQKSPAIPHILTILLAGLENDKDSNAIKLCLSTLDVIITVVMKNQPDHLAMVLPGISSKLMKLLTGSGQSGSNWQVKMATIRCFQSVLIGCFSDQYIRTQPKSKLRTEKWVTETSVQIIQCLNTILQACLKTQRESLIMVVFEFASVIIDQCFKTLIECRSWLIDIVLFCAGQSISGRAADLSTEYAKNLCQTDPAALGTFESSLATLLETLPRTLTSQDETQPVIALSSLTKLLSILNQTGSSVQPLEIFETVESSLNIELLKSAPSQDEALSLPMVLSKNRQSTSREVAINDFGIKSPFPKATEAALKRLLVEMGSLQGSQKLLDSIGDQLKSGTGPISAIRLVWIACHILKGANASENPSLEINIDFLEYCYDSIVQAGTVGSQAHPSHTTLCTYLMGEIATYQGEDFQHYLVDGLYPLFALLGNQSSLVRFQAQNALLKVVQACGYQNVTELTVDNKDYILDGISQQIHTLDISPETFGALSATIYMGGKDILPYLDDIIPSLFTLLDLYHAYSRIITGILTVFRTLIGTVDFAPVRQEIAYSGDPSHLADFSALEAALTHQPKLKDEINGTHMDLDQKIKELDERDIEEAKLARQLQGDSDDSVASDGEDNSQESEEENKEDQDDEEAWNFRIDKPVYIMLERITGYCHRLISHESPDIRAATLGLISMIIPMLAVNEKQLLPMVHQIWPQLCDRVVDKEPYIVEAAFDCVSKIAMYSRDFATNRLSKLFQKLSAIYEPMLRSEWPQFSPERRKVLAFSEALGSALEFARLDFEIQETLARILRPSFKMSTLPRLFEIFSKCNPDLIWLVMLERTLQAENYNLKAIHRLY